MNDHDIKFWVDGPTYLALKHLADADDRPLSAYMRNLSKKHILSMAKEIKNGSANECLDRGDQ